MQYRELGESGLESSVVGLGTWAIGGWMWGGTEERESIEAIRAGIDAGINLIDTAPVYGFGTSERIVGKAIEGRRDQVVLATKCGLVWHLEQGDHFFDSDEDKIRENATRRSVYKYLHPDCIAYEVEQSLQRLGVECIDLYQTHWQETTTPREDTMAALLKLKDEGKIRAIGVSNATPRQMEEYRAVGPIDTDQELYSMLDRDPEVTNLPYCAENNIAFLAYSPLGQGLLTGKVTLDREFPEGDQRRDDRRFSRENRRRIMDMLQEFRPIAEGHDITLAQLAIAWTFHQRGCTHVLAGARNPQQATENAAAGDVMLSDDEMARMQEAIESYEKACENALS